jgi:crotonobetainyl-CoA:carnitine CoA-transferase CaiB-like acyl-CoA transferase
VDSSDPRVATLVDRASNNEVVREISSQILENALDLDVDETLAKLEAADVPCAKALVLHELPDHPQIQANGLFVATEHPLAGAMVEPQNPVHFSKTPSGCGFPSPALGAHTDAILGELGYCEQDIATLRDTAVVS